ncbi:MAG: hypothetical protein ABI905_13395 [Betaproteobacteria bacterium]
MPLNASGIATSELEEAKFPISRRVLCGYAAIGVFFAVLTLAGFFAGPAFLEMFAAFGVQPSDFGERLIASVKYWVAAPLIAFAVAVDIWRRETASSRYHLFIKALLAGLIVVGVVMIPIVIWALYLPVLHVAHAG